MLDDAIGLIIPDNVSDLSKLVKDTELYITELQAEDNLVKHGPKIEYLMGLYHRVVDKLKELGINYRDRFLNVSK